MDEKLNELKRRLGEIYDLQKAVALLNWDLQTFMPPGGAVGRAFQMATLTRLAHDKLVADEIGHLLDDLDTATQGLPYEDDAVSLLRVARREYERARRVPGELVAETAQATGLAMPAWAEARARADYNSFEPHLQKILELKTREAEYIGYRDRIYDALLDEYEPGMKAAEVEAIFVQVRRELLPLSRAIAARADRVDDSILHREYDEQKQWNLTVQVLQAVGFDFQDGRQDKSVHPFTEGLTNHDVRLTTRLHHNFFNPAFFGSMHEGGHGLYEQGSPDKFERTPLAGGTSLGVHESQSRLWENLVGRSRPFWKFFLPKLRAAFPENVNGTDVETVYRAVNKVHPSFIRVEADEVTYNLHIMLRFEIENALLEQKLDVHDVPEAWNAAMQQFLGIAPPDVAAGALQDIHWSMGSIGYFPTYSLGTFFSVQLLDQARREMPDLDAQFERGEFGGLLGWLRRNLHQHGRKFTLNELAVRITGEPLQTRSYIRYLKQKYGEIYGL